MTVSCTLAFLVLAPAFAACGGGSAVLGTTMGTPTGTPPAIIDTSLPGSTATPTPEPLTPLPSPTPILPAVLERAIGVCLDPESSSDIDAAAGRARDCLSKQGLAFQTAGVAGALPVVLLQMGNPMLCRYDNFLAWSNAGGWRVQYIRVEFDISAAFGDRIIPERYSDAGHTPGNSDLARVVTDRGGTWLAIMLDRGCGSGHWRAPLLFVLESRAWRLAWNPHDSEIFALTDTDAHFEGDGIDAITLNGWAWGVPDDPRARIFSESHPGPHRVVEETWTRQVEGYVLASQHVLPSAYNTLVNFVYALSAGDDAAARARLADSVLLAAAKDLGLVQDPVGQRWQTNLDQTTVCCGPIHITSAANSTFSEKKAGPPGNVVITFAERDGDWLISGIDRE